MNRLGPTALAGLATALLCNYWVLEDALAERTDLDASWISDLAARTQTFGWRFGALQILSGLAIAGFALLLRRGFEQGSTAMRRGLLALLVAGLLVAVTGAAPLSCAEGLEPRCELAYDPVDVLHSTATFGELIATALAFLWIGLALGPASPGGRHFRRMGNEMATTRRGVTLAIGVVWLGLAALSGLGYLVEPLDGVKGLLQRADQVVFGAWLVLLGAWACR